MTLYQSSDYFAHSDPDSPQSRADRAANDLDDFAEFDELNIDDEPQQERTDREGSDD